jgi:precorrin-6B methylase 2
MAAKFPWCDYKTMADIGTGQGCLPVEIAAAHADIAATGFDLAALRPMFENYVNEYGLAERVRFLPGDFFADPMPGADVLVMGRILHNWDLPTKRMLMQKAYDALPSGGALIVYEWLIDDSRREATAGLLSSLNMLIMTAGGFDFTGTECIGWMREVGFRDLRVEPLAAAQSMVIGLK